MQTLMETKDTPCSLLFACGHSLACACRYWSRTRGLYLIRLPNHYSSAYTGISALQRLRSSTLRLMHLDDIQDWRLFLGVTRLRVNGAHDDLVMFRVSILRS